MSFHKLQCVVARMSAGLATRQQMHTKAIATGLFLHVIALTQRTSDRFRRLTYAWSVRGIYNTNFLHEQTVLTTNIYAMRPLNMAT
jgi:hypothetical protein